MAKIGGGQNWLKLHSGWRDRGFLIWQHWTAASLLHSSVVFKSWFKSMPCLDVVDVQPSPTQWRIWYVRFEFFSRSKVRTMYLLTYNITGHACIGQSRTPERKNCLKSGASTTKWTDAQAPPPPTRSTDTRQRVEAVLLAYEENAGLKL